MTSETLANSSTCLLGDEFKLAITSDRKGKYNYFCVLCNRKHSGVFHCEFCLADELYKRRKTMAFMRLDLCVQSAVCLIAKSNESTNTARAQARGANLEFQVQAYAKVTGLNRITNLTMVEIRGKSSGSLANCAIYDEIETSKGDGNDQN